MTTSHTRIIKDPIRIEPPSESDAKINSTCDSEQFQELSIKTRKTFIKFGSILYAYRTGKDVEKAKGVAILSRLPRGYFSFTNNQRVIVSGHPSGRQFRSSDSFAPHLLWLEAQSQLDCKMIRCECLLCDKEPAVSQLTSEERMKRSIISYNEKMKLATSAAVAKQKRSVSKGDRRRGRIRNFYKMSKVLIFPPSLNVHHPKEDFYLPLPKIQKPDLSLLRYPSAIQTEEEAS